MQMVSIWFFRKLERMKEHYKTMKKLVCKMLSHYLTMQKLIVDRKVIG